MWWYRNYRRNEQKHTRTVSKHCNTNKNERGICVWRSGVCLSYLCTSGQHRPGHMTQKPCKKKCFIKLFELLSQGLNLHACSSPSVPFMLRLSLRDIWAFVPLRAIIFCLCWQVCDLPGRSLDAGIQISTQLMSHI